MIKKPAEIIQDRMNPSQSRGGLGGLLDYAREQNPNTGLSKFQNFAAALDPLIMPEMRAGEAIRERGMQRVAAGNVNKTIQMLIDRGRQDLADMVQNGSLTMQQAASALLTEPKKSGKVVDATQLRAMFPNASIDDGLYNLKPDGTATKVGGGGVNVQVGSDKGLDEFAKLDAKKLATISETGSTATRSLARINRLESLLNNVETGMTANLKQIAGNFGIATNGLSDIQAAQALINSLVPEQRAEGSGPMSDADLDLFKQSLPRIINQPGGNKLIIETMRGIAQYDAMGSAIVQKFRSGEITKVEAFNQLNNRPDPFANFQAPIGSDSSMSREDALKIIE
tara:strand:+ start:272 stop:1291 length:1020 start_codon:yes stop_codon:yes gene_type:complete